MRGGEERHANGRKVAKGVHACGEVAHALHVFVGENVEESRQQAMLRAGRAQQNKQERSRLRSKHVTSKAVHRQAFNARSIYVMPTPPPCRAPRLRYCQAKKCCRKRAMPRRAAVQIYTPLERLAHG